MAKRNAPETVDAYIGSFPPATQVLLKKLRALIRKTAPAAEESISYGIAAYKYKGVLIYFAGFSKHIGLYPAPRTAPAFKKELATYKGGKGTLQFPLDQPLPADLIRRIILHRLAENDARSLAGPKKKTAQQVKVSTQDPVEQWVARLKPERQAFIQTVRGIILQVAPRLQERIKWNAPSYYYKEDILTFGPQRDDRILLVFHHPAVVTVASPLLEGNYKNRRLLYLQDEQDALKKKTALKKIIHHIIQSIDKKP